jgi:predicted amidohydrolase YtcJ
MQANSPGESEAAEALVLHGGVIHTMDPDLGSVEALRIAGGRVVAAGDQTTVERALGRSVRRVDLAGRTVLPGLIDTHPHLLHFAAMAAPLVDITDATTHGEIIERIRARARETPPGEWIMATPVGEPHFFVTRSWRDLAEGRLPDRQVLDRATREHPVMIQAWAPVTPNVIAFNSLALERLGLDASTPSQVGHVFIEKDAGGKPTGILTGSVTNYYSDDAFNESLWSQIPYLQLDTVIPATVRAMRQYNAQGVTAVYENHGMEGPFIEVYRHLRSVDELTLRVAVAQEAESYGMPWSATKSLSQFVEDCETAAASIELDDELFRFLGVSLMRDGSCWPGTIRMREPYLGPYGELSEGKEFISKDRAALTMQMCGEHGMRLNTIVMGTRAHEENLEQLEAVAGEFDLPSLHWLLVHSWFLEPEQARRYKRLGMNVTTSMAFTWGKGKLFRSRMKPSVLSDLVPLRRMLDNGLIVAGGSDWGPKSAFKQIELALTHEIAGSDEPNLGAAQEVTRAEALAMWTRDAARVLGWGDIGTLKPGNHADLAILDRDPLRCEVDEIGATAVEATLLGGRLQHGALPA